MRSLSLVALLFVLVGCKVVVPRPPVGVKISLKARVALHGEVRVAPPPPPVVVAVVNAPVVEFFGIPLEDAQDVVFVLDCSGSMSDQVQGRLAEIDLTQAPPPPPPDPAALPPPPPPPPRLPRKIDVAQAELADAIRRLPAGTRMNIVLFNNRLEAISPTFVALEDASRDGLIAFVNDKAPDGRTALAPAMRVAFLMNARRIVLLSDGLGNVGGNSRTLLRDAREAMNGGVRIDTIGLGRDQDVSLLQTLASESGGLYQRF